MKTLKNGIKVKIKSTTRDWGKYERPWYTHETPCPVNKVTEAYKNAEILVVENAYKNKKGEWECDLRTNKNELLAGFGAWELKRVFLFRR